jgi:hypothetical protein
MTDEPTHPSESHPDQAPEERGEQEAGQREQGVLTERSEDLSSPQMTVPAGDRRGTPGRGARHG